MSHPFPAQVIGVDVESRDTSSFEDIQPYGWREGLAGARVVARKLRNFLYPKHLLPKLWRVPQLTSVSAQLLYIRNSQQIREAQNNGDIDFFLRLDSVQRFDLTHYAEIEEIARNAETEAKRDAQLWLAEMKPPKAKKRHSHNRKAGQQTVALADSFLDLVESDTEDAQAFRAPRADDQTDALRLSDAPLQF